MKIIFSVISLFLFSSVFYAQNYSIRNWSVDEGLAQSEAISVSQTPDGYIWIGTKGGGISRFDGKVFKNYSTSEGLPSIGILHTTVDRKGTLWAATDAGLAYLKGNNFVAVTKQNFFKLIIKIYADRENNLWVCDLNLGLFKYNGKDFTKIPLGDSANVKTVLDIKQDNSSNYWIATYSGLFKYDGKKFTNYSTKDGLTDNYIYSVHIDKKQNVWLGGYESISKFNGNKFEVFKAKDAFGSKQIDIRNMNEDSFGNIWIATDKGLFKYDGKQFAKIKISNNANIESTYYVIEDREKNIWVGSDFKGAFLLRPNNFFNYNEKDGISGSGWGFQEDSDGYLWAATNNGLTKFENGSYKIFTEKNGLPSNVIYSTHKDQKGTMWFGTTEGLAEYKNGKFIKYDFFGKKRDKAVISINSDNKGNLWLGTFEGIYKYDGNNFQYYPVDDSVSVIVTSIYIDKEGKLWLGTEYNGIKYFDGNKFVSFYADGKTDLSKIWNITQDNKGNFWYGHGEDGIIFYNPKSKEVKHINTKNNLIDNGIISLAIDKKGFLWAGSNRGVSKLDINYFYETGRIKIKNYRKHDGFTAIECNQNAIYVDSKNNVWFGTINGITSYNSEIQNEITPESVKGSEHIFSPLLNISEVKLFNENSNISDFADSINETNLLPVNLKLPHYENDLTIHFTGINFKNPDAVLYSYKLLGFDENWSAPTKSPFATFTNLSPGSYTFLVKAKGDENIWTAEPVTFSFTVVPPFYKTWWFYAILVILFGASLIGFVKFRLHNLTKQKLELEKIVDLRTRQLQHENGKVEAINKELETINSELSKTNIELESSNAELEKLSIVARETDNAIYITDADGNLEWINTGAERMNGYTYEEFINEKGKNVFDFSSHPEIEKIIEECVIQKKSKRYEAVNNTKAGKRYYGASTITPIFDENGNVKKFVIIETDITYRKLIEQELQKAHDQLEKRVEERTSELQEANKKLKQEISIREWTEKELTVAKEKAEAADTLKSAFLAQMSHEIRTPLNVILSYSNLLSDELEGKLDDMLKTIFVGINNAGTRLIRTIDLILNMSSIQTGNFEVNTREINLNDIINKMMIEFKSLIKNDNVKLSYENRLNGTSILADEYSVVQIFQNLIDNAIKYTPEGNVKISIYSDEQQKICVDVIDEGIGISEEYLSKLFQPFSQEQIGYTRKYEGNGLGLALVKKYVELNNAEISVESKKGFGSKFTVKFKGD